MKLVRRTRAAWAIHPVDTPKEEFLRPMRITGYGLAKALAVKPQSVNDIVLKKRGISADMAMRLARPSSPSMCDPGMKYLSAHRT